MNEARRPALSVVIAATDSTAALAGCLASLARASADFPVEVIVAAPVDRIGPPHSAERVRWVAAEAGAGVGRLRGLGAACASADLIAFTEDSCHFDSGWVRAWLDAFRDPRVFAATGPVEQGPGGSVVDWSVYFCEYAGFAAPLPRGPAGRLAGNNFAVRRAALGDLSDRSVIEESQVARSVARSGRGSLGGSSAQAWHIRKYSLREAIGDRLRFGREYGGMQAAGGSGRLARVALGPGILAVQLCRLAWTLLRRRRYVEPFLESLPVTAALLTAWSAGEWLGCLERRAQPMSVRGTNPKPIVKTRLLRSRPLRSLPDPSAPCVRSLTPPLPDPSAS